MWYKTELPSEVINAFLKDSKLFDEALEQSQTCSPLATDPTYNPDTRDSKSCWISSNHWIAGFCYHYILKANEDNFKYKINSFGDSLLQYTSYSEGEHYAWHTDTIQRKSSIRKLSFTLQLSDPEDYSGGQLEFLTDTDSRFLAPKNKGTIIIFDSRVKHRVRKVTSGCRKSLVGWIEGPPWQ